MKDKDTMDARKPNIGKNFDELKMFEGLKVDEEAGRAAIAEAHRLHKRRKMVKAAVLAVCLLLVIVVAWAVLQSRPPQTLDRDLVTSCIAYDEDGNIYDDVVPGSKGFLSVEYMSDKEEAIDYFKGFYDEMMTPDYVPEGYILQKVEVSQYDGQLTGVGYIYENSEGAELIVTLSISDGGIGNSLKMFNVYDVVETDWGDAYLHYDIEDQRSLTKVYQENTLIIISAPGYTSEEELLAILEGLLT